MLWQSLDFWTWQNVTRDSEPWERARPVMSARFLEAICSFDQVVPEIGKEKPPCPIMVSDTNIQAPYKLVITRASEPLQMPVRHVECDEAQSAPRVSCGRELCWWFVPTQSPDWRALGPLPSSRLSDGQTGERCERCETFLARAGRCRVLYSLGGNRSEKININT